MSSNSSSNNNSNSNNTRNNKLFLEPSLTRLVTICAHVDHGKTTLADNLIEHNGIISERLAGTLRYLDSTPEEQRRGITMRSSAIGLRHVYKYPPNKQQKQKQKQTSLNGTTTSSDTIIVHLLDSPGHVDFSPEVSSSLQVCDGCLLVVDAVEGMCARTHQVVREAHSHQLTPILVINKIDRLCTHLCLTPTEAYLRLRTLLESVNAACAAMINSKRADDEHNGNEDNDGNGDENYDNKANAKRTNTNTNTSNNNDEENDEESIRWTFEPSKGNVIFASALFGWGFTVPSLARSLFRSKTVPIKPVMLKQYLFGDFKYKPPCGGEDSGKMLKWKADTNNNDNTTTDQQPLFAQYGLQPIWTIYEGISTAASVSGIGSTLFADGRYSNNTNTGDQNNNHNNNTTNSKTTTKSKIEATTPGMEEVLMALQHGATNTAASATGSTTIDTADKLQDILTKTGSSTSEESVVRAIIRRYRPLSDIVLDTVYEICPSPSIASSSVRPRALALVDPTITSSRTTTTTTAAAAAGGTNQENDNDGSSNDSNPIGNNDDNNDAAIEQFETIKDAVRSCSVSSESEGDIDDTTIRTCTPTVAHICKFMVADKSSIRGGGGNLNQEDDEDESSSSSTVILGLARVLSGTLKADNSKYFVYGPKHQFANVDTPQRSILLYLLMGSSFVSVPEVPAGHLCAIQNLDDVQMKTATICDSMYGMPLRGFTDHGLRPLVKVNVETVNPLDTPVLERGLIKLSLADAAVEVTATARGERILACLGELHLEQSILDLKNIYCDNKDIEFRISEPIVDFGETTDWFRKNDVDLAMTDDNKTNNIELDFVTFFNQSMKERPLRQLTIPPYNEEEGIEFACRGRSRCVISGRVGAISLRVIPLDTAIYHALKHHGKYSEKHEGPMNDIKSALGFPSDCSPQSALEWLHRSIVTIDANGNAMVSTQALENGITVSGVQSTQNEIYVPRKANNDTAATQNTNDDHDDDSDPNSLEEDMGLKVYESVRSKISENGFLQLGKDDSGKNLSNVQSTVLSLWKEQLSGSLVAGFQMAMRAGPVCEEPVRGVMVVIEGIELALSEAPNASDDSNLGNLKPAKQLSGGMIAATVRVGIRSALLSRPVRLVESYLKLTLHSSLAGLGPLYSILSRRRGKVLDDSMVDGTDLLEITAMLPHAESFGLAPELFRESSGEVTAPELVFSHWERLEQEHDPFWIPTSLEEREDFGELSTTGDVSTGLDNTALQYIRKVRKRKGLMVDSTRTVVAAEKQRTIKK